MSTTYPSPASAPENTKKRITSKDLQGLMAPVFTCFKNDSSNTLSLKYIDRYAKWLQQQHVIGVLVNGISGEGPALGIDERKANAEMWVKACNKYKLTMLCQVGGCPLPDVLELARHAEKIGADAVVSLPELFYKPKNIDQLVGFCKIVAKHCSKLPFIYYHIPRFTQVEYDMDKFCTKAEKVIPTFIGIQYSSRDLEMGFKCLKEGRAVLLGSSTLLGPGMLLGFECNVMTVLNIRPEIGWDIYLAMRNLDLPEAKKKQREINDLIIKEANDKKLPTHVEAMKMWFNKEMEKPNGAGFSAGPARKLF